MKKQKTFQEGDDISDPFNWIDDIIWAYASCPNPKEFGEERYELDAKMKITIEITTAGELDPDAFKHNVSGRVEE
jgi:hypothetical protein